MRRATVGLLVGCMVLGGLGPTRADGAPADHRERVAQLRALAVRPGPARVDLPESRSVVEVGPALSFLVGADARSFMRLTQGVDHPRVEAVVIGGRRGFVFVEWFDPGYVATADWHRLDPARLMERIRRATADANARRRAAGVAGIEVVGWEGPPRRIGDDGVRWAIRAVEEGETTVNATVLKLGRRGYQKLTWVGAGVTEGAPDTLLDEVVAGHRFRAGHGYTDHARGDPVAPFGIAALVTGAVGAAPPERGGGAAVAAVLPKAWPAALLLALLWGLWAALRRGTGSRWFLFAAAPGRHKLSRHDRRDP